MWIDEDGTTTGPIEADVLIAILAPRYTASGSSGSSVPAMDTVGSGTAFLFAEGEVVEGTWARDGIEEMFRLEDGNGNELEVPAGVPWVNIFPNTRQISW